ncbi:ABC transporter ATP-binding protein [Desulfobacterales bacterium HSG16]|nr:ABC transporter ATP-binding protein [Desulfobacterales bacterium HSG16]
MPMLNDYPVIARNLTYKAGFSKKIIDNISLALKKNEFVGLIGGSGSGKTTLLTCLNGYKKPSDGSVILNGISGKEKANIRNLIGYVPQDDIVHKTLTVERALYYSYILRLEDDIPDDKIEYHVNKIIYQLGLREHKNKKIAKLSGGQRKRVSIGIELLHSPQLFFLDEPTAGLDPSLERQMMRLLANLADDNRLIVLTTHLMQNVEMFDVLIFLHKGHMIYCGPSTEITSFFEVRDMIDLFDKVLVKDPLELQNDFFISSVNRDFLDPRLRACSHV